MKQKIIKYLANNNAEVGMLYNIHSMLFVLIGYYCNIFVNQCVNSSALFGSGRWIISSRVDDRKKRAKVLSAYQYAMLHVFKRNNELCKK